MRPIVNILLVSLALGAATLAKADAPIYNSNPNPVPGNLTSLGYQATQTVEFGELIQFAAGGRNLTTITVTMSDWALKSDYPSGDPSGFTLPLTLNLYNVGAGDTVGSSIASKTVDALIPWRPEATAGCADGKYLAADGHCYSGSLSQVTFDFTGVVAAPDSLIYGLAFSTQSYGASPYGSNGPYNSLNFALNSGAPTVGSNPLPDTAYWNTATAGWYTDGGAGGVGIFRQDTAWAPLNAAITVNAPEPGSILLLGSMLLGVTGLLKRKLL